MSIQEFHLDKTVEVLTGPTKEQITVFNQWAAVGLDEYNQNSQAEFEFLDEGNPKHILLKWNSNFSKDAMRERKKIAEEGGVSLALFVMSVLLDYKFVQQSEIGEGVDYGFQKNTPDLNNFFNDCHYVEISGLLEENGSNTLARRVQIKHEQIDNGTRRSAQSFVIVTLFNRPTTVKELHR